MQKIIDYKVLSDYMIWLKFQDGHEKTVNIRPHIGKGFTRELLNENEFKKVKIEEGGGLEWDNGFDMCPNFLRQLEEETKVIA